jgi:hypothetical protein
MSTITQDFTYSFTDSGGNVFDVTITATNSEEDPDTYTASAASGTVNGSSVIGLSTFYEADNLINISGANGYSTFTGFSYSGVAVETADGTEWNMYNDPDTGNSVTISVIENGGDVIPADFQVVPTLSCFTPGTLISTPTGSTPVEDLQIGDLILNHVGESVPVKWIGAQRFHPVFIKDGLPVCIRQSALGNGLPSRDLDVSPGHAMYIDDCLLIDAKAMINGTTITQVTQWEGDIEYFHIETEHHEIILAEGALAETFVDNVSRVCFNNYSEYQALYPDTPEMIELDIPRVSHQRQLPNTIKHKLEQISQELMGDGDTGKVLRVG